MIRWQQRGLQFKHTLGISLILIVVLGVAIIGAASYIQNQLWKREILASKNLNSIATTLLEDAMMNDRTDKIQQAIESLGQSTGGQIDNIAIYNSNSTLIAFATDFPGSRSIPKSVMTIEVTEPTCWECHRFPAEDRPDFVVVTLNGKQVLRNVVPLYNESRCQSCHGTEQSILGDSIVDISLDQYRQSINTISMSFGLGFLVVIGLVVFSLHQFVQQLIINPLEALEDGTRAIITGNLNHEFKTTVGDEIGKVGNSFNKVTSRIRDLISSLEQRVQERTKELQERTSYLEASAEISHRAAAVLNPESMIQEIVELIKERFDLYYVGLFLLDKDHKYAVLKAGTGEEGKTMLKAGHRLEIGRGMIGWCIENAENRIALDIGEDATRFSNPNLPDTRTEGALPLRSRGRVLGALTIQSSLPAAFNKDTITVLQTLADQIAVAFDNAQIYMESQAAIESERRIFSDLSNKAWQDYLKSRPDIGILVSEEAEILPASKDWTPEMMSASQNGEIIRAGDRTIAVPIILRGQVLGVIRLKKNQQETGWQDDEIDLLATLVDQLESALESARYYEDTQRLAARERLVTEISTKIRSTNDPQEMLKTAVIELRQALDAKRAQMTITAQKEIISHGGKRSDTDPTESK